MWDWCTEKKGNYTIHIPLTSDDILFEDSTDAFPLVSISEKDVSDVSSVPSDVLLLEPVFTTSQYVCISPLPLATTTSARFDSQSDFPCETKYSAVSCERWILPRNPVLSILAAVIKNGPCERFHIFQEFAPYHAAITYRCWQCHCVIFEWLTKRKNKKDTPSWPWNPKRKSYPKSWKRARSPRRTLNKASASWEKWDVHDAQVFISSILENLPSSHRSRVETNSQSQISWQNMFNYSDITLKIKSRKEYGTVTYQYQVPGAFPSAEQQLSWKTNSLLQIVT